MSTARRWIPRGGPGGGVTAVRDATDVDTATALVDGKLLAYDASVGKFVGVDAPAPAGGSLPAGGAAGQVLKKNSSTDGDAGWAADLTGAGGAGVPSRLPASPAVRAKRTLYADFANPSSVEALFEVRGQNAVHTLSVTNAPTSGSATATHADGRSISLPFNLTRQQLGLLLKTIYGPGTVRVTGGPWPATALAIEFIGPLAGQQVTPLVVAAGTLNNAAVPALTSTTTGGSQPWSYSVDAADGNRAVVTPADTTFNPRWILTRPEYSFRNAKVRGRVRIPAAPHTATALQLIGRYTDPGNYLHAEKIWNPANAFIEIVRKVDGTDNIVQSTAQADMTDTTVWHFEFLVVNEFSWFKCWKAADHEPDYQIARPVNPTNAAGGGAWGQGRWGMMLQVVGAGFLVQELQVSELDVIDDNLVINGDLRIADSSTGAPHAITLPPQTAGQGLGEFIQVAGPDGETRRFFHGSRSVDGGGGGGMAFERIYVSDYTGRTRPKGLVIPSWAEAIEFFLLSKADSVRHGTAGNDFLGAALVAYQYDELDTLLNLGLVYYQGLGPDPTNFGTPSGTNGTAGTGTWPFGQDHGVLKLCHNQNGGGRVAYIDLTLGLHDTDALADNIWINDLRVRAVA